MWLQHYSDHLSWHCFFLQFRMKLLASKRCVKMLPRVRSVTETDSWAAVCLTAGQRSSWSVRKMGRHPGRPISESDGHPAGLHQSVQVISASVVCRQPSQVLLCRTDWVLSHSSGFLTSLKTISKILNMIADLHIRCFLHSLNYLAALEVRASVLRTNTLHATPPLRCSCLDLPMAIKRPGSSLKIKLSSKLPWADLYSVASLIIKNKTSQVWFSPSHERCRYTTELLKHSAPFGPPGSVLSTSPSLSCMSVWVSLMSADTATYVLGIWKKLTKTKFL